MRASEVAKRGVVEMIVGIAIYTAILVPALRYGPSMEPGSLRTFVLVSPMIGFLLAMWAVIRNLARIDEYLRMRTLENIAIAAGVTMGATFTYGFLENAGYPRLTMFMVWPVMGAVWAIVAIFREHVLRWFQK